MKLKQIILGVLAMAAISSCSKNSADLAQGPWLGVLVLDSTEVGMEVPFNMNVIKNGDGTTTIDITNADEKISATEVTFKGDTLIMKFPVFSSEIYAVVGAETLNGFYYPKGKENGICYKFYATKGVTDRFPNATEAPTANIQGRWDVMENPGTPDSTYMVGEFKQDGAKVTGTWLNTGGDMRYLEGKISGNKLMLSAADGAHTIIMTGEVTADGKIENGKFMGSPKWKSVWTATKNDNANLPSVESLIHLKKGPKTFEFACVNLSGDTIRLSDEQFKGKVVIVTASGSWCPNCMDENRFYAQLDSKYRDKGLEIVALCFENKDLASSKKGMERFAEQTGASYTFLYAGPRGKETKDKVLYNLEGQVAFPTSIFINRKGEIVKLHTGFSGPGTGEHYTKLVEETTALVEKLLSE